MTRALLAIAISLLPGVAWAIETHTQSISFEACLETIRSISAQYDVAPTNIAETNDLRVVKWFLSDGNVMVACSRPDQKMVVTN
jgi:hypothetical protein